MSKTKVIEIFERTQMVVQIGTDTKGRVVTVTHSVDDLRTVNDKGCEGCKYEHYNAEICKTCMNSYVNRWESAKDDKIVVGDEVEWTGDKYIVTYINYNIDTSEITDYDLLGEDGSVAEHVKKCSFVKTGRHFDITSILEDMRCGQ